MPGIHTLELSNFKAFPVVQKFELEGKHGLFYGENGSGKSSVHWALYTLFQATDKGKTTDNYFDRSHTENLLNTYTEGLTNEAWIKLSLATQPQYFYQLDGQGRHGFDTTLTDTHFASDFISHRLLVNVYNFAHSQQINLFSVFERDVLPFIQTSTGESFSELWEEIKTTKPYARKVTGVWQKTALREEDDLTLTQFNTEIQNLLARLQTIDTDQSENRLSVFYNRHFGNCMEDLEINLNYIPALYLSTINQDIKIENRYKTKDFWKIQPPMIILNVRQKVNKKLIPIHRPQSFYNEARLTGIALTIRFCVLEERPINVENKILVLDDLLISLDMSNRERVIDLLLTRYLNKYQFLIFTHERAFFHLLRRRLEHHYGSQTGMEEKWKLYEVYEHDGSLPNERIVPIPLVLDWKNPLAKAKAHFRAKDYPACANYLRSYLEEWFQEFIPSQKRRDNEGNEVKMLHGLLSKAKDFFDELPLSTTILTELNLYRETLLNWLSHHDNAYAEVFRSDLEGVFGVIDRLQKIQKKCVLPINAELTVCIDTQQGSKCEFVIQLTDDFYLLKDDHQIEFKEQATICAKQLAVRDGNTNRVLAEKERKLKNKTWQQIYNDFCVGCKDFLQEDAIPVSDIYEVFIDSTNRSLAQLLYTV